MVTFWVLVFLVVFGPVGEPKDIMWYLNVSLSIALVAVCVCLVIFGTAIVYIKRCSLGVSRVVLALLVLFLCNVPGSIALYFYLKNKRLIGTA